MPDAEVLLFTGVKREQPKQPTAAEIDKVARWCGVMALELADLRDGKLRLVKAEPK